MITKETIRIKVKSLYIDLTASLRAKKIINKDFTIISNNCWAGFIYQSYKIKYNTPTIGLFFMAEDYILFLKDIKRWLRTPIIFIEPQSSKYKDHFKEWKKFGEYPIGKFVDSDIEIHFLHYKSDLEAIEAWNRRVDRINWNRILYKFNDQNLCDYRHIEKFSKLPYKNKVCFTAKKYDLPNITYIKCQNRSQGVSASYEPVGASKNLNINKLINRL